MNITNVILRLAKEDKTKIRAFATIEIDNEFVIHDIKVVNGEKGLFIAMPSKLMKNGEYKDIAHPINTISREQISRAVLDKYKEEIAS